MESGHSGDSADPKGRGPTVEKINAHRKSPQRPSTPTHENPHGLSFGSLSQLFERLPKIIEVTAPRDDITGGVVVPTMDVDQQEQGLPGFRLDSISHLPELPMADQVALVVHLNMAENDPVFQNLDGESLGLTIPGGSRTRADQDREQGKDK
jgi:hypothetical protein